MVETSRLAASRLGQHVQRKGARKEGTERYQAGSPWDALRLLPVSKVRNQFSGKDAVG